MAGDTHVSALKIGELFKKAGKKKIIIFSILLATAIILGIVGAIALNRVEYTVLYTGLDPSEAGTIKDLLDELGVKSKVSGTDTILVPKDKADELRIELAAQGYPQSGLNYDIFKSASSLGSTDFEQRTLKQYQLESNMRATISKFNKVKDCIVIVNLAEPSSYVVSKSSSKSSVSILLDLVDGEKLTTAEAKAIAQFAQKCVPELELENISITDTQLNYYYVTSDDDSDFVPEYTATQLELTEATKKILRDQALCVIEPAVGSGNVSVSVNVKLNFDTEKINKVEFSPPVEGELEGLIRSSEEIYEATREGNTGNAAGDAGTDNNGVGSPGYPTDDGDENGNTTSEKKHNTYNYELNEIRTQIEKAKGTISDLSVAVLINSEIKNISNYTDTIKSLVANAIGVDDEYVSVGLIPFIERAGDLDFEDYLKKNEEIARQYVLGTLIKSGITAGAFLIGLLLILLFTRKKKIKAKKAEAAAAEGAPATAENITPEVHDESVEGDTQDAKKDDKKLIEELVIKKSSASEKVEELVDKYPDTAVQILRTWLSED